MFSFPTYIIWLAATIGLVVFEAATVGLTCVWFAIGAICAFFLSLMGASFPVQVLVFALVSALSLILLRPLAAKRIYTNKTPTNADRLIGETAIVTERIDNDAAIGQASVRGQAWSAKSADGAVIEAGAKVRIREISGVKLVVESME